MDHGKIEFHSSTEFLLYLNCDREDKRCRQYSINFLVLKFKIVSTDQ